MQKRVAILGAGYIADYHRDALRLIPDLQLMAVCDLNEARAQRFAGSAGIDQVYTDLKKMLEKEELECVHVLTPPADHFGPAKQVLEAGVGVYIEKPLCANSKDCDELVSLAKSRGLSLGVSHNFLCAEPYERLLDDLKERRLGRLDQIDIIWHRALPQIKSGPFSSWLFASPKHILFEVAPHCFAHALHLAGDLEDVNVDFGDEVELASGHIFYRRWEIRGRRGRTHVRMLLSFIDALSQHYISIRGTNGSARVDFERNTYVRYEHTHQQMDLDNYKSSLSIGLSTIAQATKNMRQFVLSKAGFNYASGPLADSIYRALKTFYRGFPGTVDDRISGEMGADCVRLGERIAEQVPSPDPREQSKGAPQAAVSAAERPASTILVTGGTGFIGRALVKRLRQKGHGVRVLARSPQEHQAYLDDIGAEVVKGDMLDFSTVEAALDGIRFVYHLARGGGQSWYDYEKSDFVPTKKLAEACLSREIELIYTSSIAIYAPSNPRNPIRDDTPPHKGRARSHIYARSKAESERFLQDMHRKRDLKLVIVRPGIVIGKGCTPLHPGVGAFPYSFSMCSITGKGDTILPIILVGDCADAMALVVEKELANVSLSGRSFNLVGEPCLTAHQYLDELERCSGVKVKRIMTPPWRSYLLEVFKWFVKSMGRNPDAARPSYNSVKGLGYLSLFDIKRVKEELGWKPTQDREKVIREGIEVPARESLD